MIYTLTFNPALDYVLKIPDFCEGKVNRPVYEGYTAGGKGINVSAVLSSLGIENTALGFIAGFTGDEIEKILKVQKINTDFIRLKNGCSRINVKLKGAKETEINAKGPEIQKKDIELLINKIQKIQDGDFLVLAGSVPKGVSDSIYRDIMKELKHKKIKIVADAEKELLENVLDLEPFLIKPNHHELGEIFKKNITAPEEAAKYAALLRERGAKNVLVSMAETGGVLADENGKTIFFPAPKGTLVNSTGAGDSTVAGFISEYISSNDTKKALVTALCAGSATAFSDFLATGDEIKGLLNSINENEIKYL